MDFTVQAILKAARKRAMQVFGHLPDATERANDVASTAWELSLRASDKATLSTIVNFAVRRVTVRRHFAESMRGLETIPKEKRANRNIFRRVPFDHKLFASKRDDPAELATFRIDYPAWFDGLTPQQQRVVKMLAVGERTGTIAQRLQVSPSRVSKIREELAASWIAAHS